MKEPERTCIVCRGKFNKKSLIRIVKNKEDILEIDIEFKKNARGAYLCKNSECLEKLKKVRGLERSFKKHISDDIYNKLISELNLLKKDKNG